MQYSQLAIAAYRLTHAKYEVPWLATGQPRISIVVAAPCAETLIESRASIPLLLVLVHLCGSLPTFRGALDDNSENFSSRCCFTSGEGTSPVNCRPRNHVVV